ncbi:MAG TPA: hypothetical protein VD757_01705 [Candidatus Nitrosocosmicus sp.]|nr:hypothetical protein [Candidatus Nitrosocosmicus sp.]
MLREAIEFLMNQGKTEVIELNGQKYSTHLLSHIKLVSPESIRISTLSGLVDYIKANDTHAGTGLYVHVANYDEVRLYSGLKSDASRDCYILCKAETPKITFGSFMDMENFNIMLQACFERTDDRDKILSVVGNIKEESVKAVGDDGVSQQVTARVGIARVGDVVVPNPVILQPFRTFAEVEQPMTKFVFRMQSGPRAALIEADGGAWKAATMLCIKEYLSKELDGTGVKIIA